MDSIVYLIGAGPGDPGLITVKGRSILQSADVVIYDSLINKKLLKTCKPDARLIDVGKSPGKKVITQNEINKKLVYYSKRKKTVARLKGGDPFIFGRGGEEAESLVKAGVTIEIIPGVSSVSSVPGYAGVPLTHRRYNSSFTVVTGHENPFKAGNKLNWDFLSDQETLVFLMSLKNIKLIMKKLTAKKLPPNTPVLVTTWGTVPRQRSVIGTIENISDIVLSDPQIVSPAIIVVGKVVNLKNRIGWYEKKPLFGKNIVITRAEDQSVELNDKLSSYGAEVTEFPTIQTVPVKSKKEIDRSINEIKKFDYLIFTSVNGVKYFLTRVFEKKFDARIFNGKKIIAIGEKTGLELKNYGLLPDMIPSKYTAEGILNKLKGYNLKNKKFLIPRAKIARDLIPNTLKELKADVTVINCYETVLPKIKSEVKNDLVNRMKNNSIDLITFTSSSTVTNLLKLLNNNSIYLKNCDFASIGPITSDTLKSNGLTPKITARKHTIDGLVTAILNYYSKNS